MDENVETAYNQSRIVVAFIISGAPEVVLQRHNIPLDSTKAIKDALGQFDFKTASSLVTTDMIDAFSVCGTTEDIQKKVGQMEELGINELVVGSPIGKDRIKSLKLLEDVISSFN